MAMGTGHITKTTAVEFIPTLWRDEVQAARQRNLVMKNLVRSFVHPAGKGDTINIPKISNLAAAQDVSAQTAVTFEAITEGKVQVAINKYKAKGLVIENIVGIQSAYDLRQLYTQKMGYELAKVIDSDLLGLYTGVTQTTGAGGVDIDEDNILEAAQKLDEADAPNDERYLVIIPSQKAALLRIPRLTEYNATGEGGAMLPGEFGYELHGFKVFVTNQVPTASSIRRNLAFHKEAFLYVEGHDVQVDALYDPEWLGTKVVAWELYGVLTYRADHAVVVQS